MRKRFSAVLDYTAECMKAGEIVYSPIVHNHPVAQRVELPVNWEFWKRIDFTFLKLAGELRVLCIDGWERSTGVHDEMAYAKELGIPIRMIDPTKPVAIMQEGKDHIEKFLNDLDEINPGTKKTFEQLIDRLNTSDFLKEAMKKNDSK